MNQEKNLDEALEAIRNGEFVLVFDDDDREGEVDMIIASEFVTPKSIATMRNDAGGLICNCLHADFCDAIHLPFMVDIMNGVTDLDEAVAGILRRTKKPVVLVCNKTDNNETYLSAEFYSLGLGDPQCISAATGGGTGDLLDLVVSLFPK